jgi:transcriptional regulator with XRE-family HTH domain
VSYLILKFAVRRTTHIPNRCRKIANLTQPEFASKTGVALKVLRKIEQNKTNVELSGVLKILNMFGCTLDVKKIE